MVRARSIVLLALAGCVAGGPPADEPVAAVRYRELIVEGFLAYAHGGGQWHDVLYLPAAGIYVQVVWSSASPLDEKEPVMHAYYGPPSGSLREPVQVQIPAVLAAQIVELARRTKERDEFAAKTARVAVEAAVVRGLESVKSRDDEPGVPELER